MKSVLSNLLVLSITLTTSLSSVQADDVVGNKEIIVITKNSQNQINLKHCLKDKDIVLTNTCNQIGSKEFYSLAELKSVKNWEIAEAYGKTGGAVVAVGVAAVIGAYTGILAYGVTWTGAAVVGAELGIAADVFMIGGLIGGGVIGAVEVSDFDIINPVVQFKQAYALNNKILEDLDYREQDEVIKSLAIALNQILK